MAAYIVKRTDAVLDAMETMDAMDKKVGRLKSQSRKHATTTAACVEAALDASGWQASLGMRTTRGTCIRRVSRA